MKKKTPLQITIIGGGFCGIMTAINLMQRHSSPLNIHLINKGYPVAKGVAYDPHTSGLLLNVPNSRMSAFADMPDHFIKWLQLRQPSGYESYDDLAAGFSTREQYGYYLTYIWQEALNDKPAITDVTIYEDEAYDIVEDGSQFYVYLKSRPVLTSDFVVLATGNVQPGLPSGIPLSFSYGKYYFGNPWKRDCIENLTSTADILIVGNGLTMADTVMGLAENGFAKNIHTVSRHGYNLNPWKDTIPPYTHTDIQAMLSSKIELLDLVKNLNKHRKKAAHLNQSSYHMIDSLRPHVQKIWQSISWEEKQQFIKYLRHLWGSVRHRLPEKMHVFIGDMYTQKRLFTYKGNITTISESGGLVNVTLNCRGVLKSLVVERIINCTGPESDLKSMANELLKNLNKSGLICPDALNMGINARPDGSVITANGHCKSNLFVIGTNLKGILWESTAVPELRLQAAKLAEQLIVKCNQAFDAQENLANVD